MFAERLLTTVMRSGGKRFLKLEPTDFLRFPEPRPNREYLLYAHVPFCERLCPYCSFNRFPFEEERARAYFRDLREEMRIVSRTGYNCRSMYVGGGTPTVLVDELCDTIDLARELFDIREVSSETNPNHLIPEVVDPLVDRVQRMSVGVQSFDDGLLKRMDRYEKYGSCEEIVERLRAVAGRFHSLNVDLIFNFPTQTEAMLLHDIETVKESGCNQTTFYPLMVSPAVAHSLRRSVGRVDYSREHEFYHTLTTQLADTFEPASAWTFSRVGGGMIDEYIVDYEDYVGVGSGAFSFLDGSLYANTFSLAQYSSLVADGRPAAVARRMFSLADRMRYRFLMSLFGLSLDRAAFRRDFGAPVERGLPLEMAFMRLANAFAIDTEDELTVTPQGRYLLVAMMREFFVGVNNLRDQARAALPEDERQLLFGEGEGDAGGTRRIEAALGAASAGE